MSLPNGIDGYPSINDDDDTDAQKYLRHSESTTHSDQYGAIPIKQTETYPLETTKQRCRRYLSLAIIMFSMMVSSIGFSSIFGSIWQYYEKIDDTASESFLGLIVAAYSLGSLVAAPVFGIWSNYRPVAEPLIFSLIIYSGGNLLYVYAETFSEVENWILFTSRFIVGVGSANIAVMRSYCSAASQEDERNTVMSFLSAVQATGFILGPALGLLFQPLGDDGLEWDAIDLHFNLYTGPGFLGVFLCIVNAILIVFFFKEFNVHGTKTKKSFSELHNCCQDRNKEIEKPLLGTQEQRYDTIAAWVCIWLFFIILTVFAAVETIYRYGGVMLMFPQRFLSLYSLMALIAKDQYAWSNKDATLYVNIIAAGNSILSVAVFIGTRYVAKWSSERLVLITGLVITICGFIIWIPYGPGYPDVEMTALTNSSDGQPLGDNPELGCNFHKQSWCLHQPMIHLPQYVGALCVVTVGYCASLLLCYTIFSKILGPWPQGLMMGYITMSGSLGRIVGPLLLAKVYSEEGPRLTFIVSISFVFFGVLTVVAFYRRIVPYSVYQSRLQSMNSKKYNSPNRVNVNTDQSNTISYRDII